MAASLPHASTAAPEAHLAQDDIVGSLLTTMDSIVDPGLMLQEEPDYLAASSQAHELVWHFLGEYGM